MNWPFVLEEDKKRVHMGTQVTSKKRATAVFLTFFLLALAAICFFGNWWPDIMLAIGIPLAIRQYLLGRHYDMYMSLFVFIGTFITAKFDISWEILLPILFTIAGIYIFCREFLDAAAPTEEEEEEDINHEIEEDEHK